MLAQVINSWIVSIENANQIICLLVMLVYRQTLPLYILAGTLPIPTKMTNTFEQFDHNNRNSGGANIQKWEGGAHQH